MKFFAMSRSLFSVRLARSFSSHTYYREKDFSKVAPMLAKIDDLKSNIADMQSKIDENLKSIIQQKLKMHWTYNSNALEGSKLGLGDTIFFLQHGLTVGGKPFKDFLDSKNHAEALDYFYSIVTDSTLELTAYTMQEINALLLAGVTYTPAVDAHGKRVHKKATPGVYKVLPNHVLTAQGIHTYVDPVQVPAEMDMLFQWVKEAGKSGIHDVIRAAIAHYNLVRIHPFDDGNGRCARILLNLILMRNSYPPAIISVTKRMEYLDSLVAADHGNISPFIHFVASSLLETETMIVEDIQQHMRK